MIDEKLLRRFYPDKMMNGTHMFYAWLRSGLSRDLVVANIGAGLTASDRIRSLRGEVKRVIGLDIDPDVKTNQDLDESHVIRDKFPLPDASVDAAWADYVLEHVERPDFLLSEVFRILKPGGNFYFRTPNIFNYVTLISRFTPHAFHPAIVKWSQGLSAETHEPYKTYYRMNSGSALNKMAAKSGFAEVELKYVECEPDYLMFHPVPFYLGVLHERVVNSSNLFAFLRANIFGRFKK